MEKTQPEDRNEVDNEPVGDDELEDVSGGVDWRTDPGGFPASRRGPQTPDPLSGTIGELTGS